ncbi:hypothetical protein LCGC14_0878430 [marine sediment metagenome]|uniref:Phage protein Gp37/Gp68 n=1 Tax=marine sediment metagenome TaxID=412755 RepID=A0A0F9S9N4_9ZZZZ
MGDTKIPWADKTWSPVTGCTKVSPGCAHCYAEAMSLRFGWSKHPWTPEHAAENVVLHPARLDYPLHLRKPQRIFCCSMGDLFHEAVPIEFIRAVFYVMERASQHTFLVLTKRIERAAAHWKEYLLYPPPDGEAAVNFHGDAMAHWFAGRKLDVTMTYKWPPNVHLGVSVENQAMADERIPKLLATPAAKRFVSAEPLLGAVDLTMIKLGKREGRPGKFNAYLDAMACTETDEMGFERKLAEKHRLHQVIVGGESGPGHRDMDLAWVQAISDQCEAAGVAYFGKSLGGPTQKAPLPGHLGRRELVP